MATIYRTYLMVTDVDESIPFYRDVLGLTVTERAERRAKIGDDGCGLVLEEDFDEDTLAAFGLDPPGSDRGAGVIVNVEVADVDATYDRAKAHDATVLASPMDVEWAERMTLLGDPDGYVIEAAQRTG